MAVAVSVSAEDLAEDITLIPNLKKLSDPANHLKFNLQPIECCCFRCRASEAYCKVNSYST